MLLLPTVDAVGVVGAGAVIVVIAAVVLVLGGGSGVDAIWELKILERRKSGVCEAVLIGS